MRLRTVICLVQITVLFASARMAGAQDLGAIDREFVERVRLSLYDAIERSLKSANPANVAVDELELLLPEKFNSLNEQSKRREALIVFQGLNAKLRQSPDETGSRIVRNVEWSGSGKLIRAETRWDVSLNSTHVIDTVDSGLALGYPAYLDVETTAAEESLWESTLLPVLVSVGAAVIVALFFFVRS